MSAVTPTRDVLHLRPAGTPQPFRSAEAAWFWAFGIFEARKAGAGAAFGHQRRICEPDDLLMALDRLYRRRRIDLAHARALRVWGEKGEVPPDRSGDARLWREAMTALDQALRVRGIVQ